MIHKTKLLKSIYMHDNFNIMAFLLICILIDKLVLFDIWLQNKKIIVHVKISSFDSEVHSRGFLSIGLSINKINPQQIILIVCLVFHWYCYGLWVLSIKPVQVNPAVLLYRFTPSHSGFALSFSWPLLSWDLRLRTFCALCSRFFFFFFLMISVSQYIWTDMKS